MTASQWMLHPQLAADTHPVISLPLCDVQLMDDAHYPWLVLVPRIADAVEWLDLADSDRHRLLDEVTRAGNALRQLHSPDKLNIAALGNVVAQLHVHVVARFHTDAAWPRPVWGATAARHYDAVQRAACIGRLARALSLRDD